MADQNGVAEKSLEDDAAEIKDAIRAAADLPEKAKDKSASKGDVGVVSLKNIHGIKVNVQAILGSLSLSVSKLANLKKGEMLELDTCIGETIEIRANGHLIAKGEIVVVEGDAPSFGITVTEVLDSNVPS